MREIDQQLAREYAHRRAQNERERDERIREVYARDPRIRLLHDEMRSRFAAGARAMLSDRGQAARLAGEMRGDTARVQAEIKGRLEALGLPEDYMRLRYRCAECRDTGYTSEFGRQMCACHRMRRVELMRERAHLADAGRHSFEAFDPSVFPSEEQRKQAEAAMRLCKKYADALSGPGKLNLILMGESGLGKTFLLNCIADRAIQNGVPALPVTAFHILSAMKAYHFGDNGESAMLHQLIRCELLLIDDLGTEPMLRNVTIEYLFMLLNERMNAGRHTVVATNLTPNELQERYNERVLSRLLDRTRGEFIRLTGRDLRFREA